MCEARQFQTVRGAREVNVLDCNRASAERLIGPSDLIKRGSPISDHERAEKTESRDKGAGRNPLEG
jgi:hypothetical protein